MWESSPLYFICFKLLRETKSIDAENLLNPGCGVFFPGEAFLGMAVLGACQINSILLVILKSNTENPMLPPIFDFDELVPVLSSVLENLDLGIFREQ